MIELNRPELVFDKQKVYSTGSDVENKTMTGVEVKSGKEVVILFSQAPGETLQGEERSQLLKIITACKLKEEDIVLVNTAFAPNVSLSWLRKNFPVKTVMVFGDMALSKNLVLKKYFAYSIDGLKLVRSEPLARLLKSDADKKALWGELKKVFEITPNL